MKSSIKVELGTLNKPVIRMRIVPSDDVRDVLFQQFKETFAGVSDTCRIYFHNTADAQGTTTLDIIPVAPGDLHPALIPDQDSNKLPSRHQIDDLVSTEDIFDGQVVAVRFTIGKVYYDILNKLTGDVIRDIDSCDIIQEIRKVPAAS